MEYVFIYFKGCNVRLGFSLFLFLYLYCYVTANVSNDEVGVGVSNPRQAKALASDSSKRVV